METTKEKKTENITDKAKPQQLAVVRPGEQLLVPIRLIDLSPLNYRKHFDEQALTEFAGQLIVHGVLQNVTVRKVGGRYELVAGERRYRAAKIAGLETLPAIVKELTDEQVVEIQLAENLHRENPHPMHEAQAMAQLKAFGKDYEEIGKKIGRSKALVYKRLQLNELLPELQDLFLADKIALRLANEIAPYGKEEQREILEVLVTGDNEYEIKSCLQRLQANLLKAPFDIESENLLKGVSSCIGCPFNSATVASLFPESEAKAFCKHKQCYANKCDAHFSKIVEDAVSNFGFEAIVSYYDRNSSLLKMLKEHSNSKNVPIVDFHTVDLYFQEEPKREDFNFTKDEPIFDEEGYREAVEDYREECEKLELLKQHGNAKLCLYVGDDLIKQAFSAKRDNSASNKGEQISAKDVQNAMKEGTVTADLLEREIDRLQAREIRSKELDREKVYLEIHTRFSEQNTELANVDGLTKADIIAGRLLVYNSLDYWARRKIDATFDNGSPANFTNSDPYELFAQMTDQQFCQMVRLALANQSGSKLPSTIEGKILYRVAKDSGIDTANIENEQDVIATERESRKNERVEIVRRQIEMIESQEQKA